jgi:hypothetical protein
VSAKLISLSEWASRRYNPAPHPNTLRRWVREAKIVPVPKKHGRAYYVEEDARYTDWNDLSEPPEAHLG